MLAVGAVFLSVIFSAGAHTPCEVTGEPIILNRSESSKEKDDFKNSAKAKDLLRVEFITEDYKVCVEGQFVYGTRFFSRYTVTENKHLERYVYAQFLRGFVYEISSVNGLRTNATVVHRHHDGVHDDLWHSEWTVDTDNANPVYTSSFGYKSRFQILHWNRDEYSFEYGTEESHAIKRSPYKHAYIWDRPATAFTILDKHAREVGLEFRTCIFNARDIPDSLRPEKERPFILSAETAAIACFEWNSIWSFNPEKQEYERLNEIPIIPPLDPAYN